jgi:hypothetical protein
MMQSFLAAIIFAATTVLPNAVPAAIPHLVLKKRSCSLILLGRQLSKELRASGYPEAALLDAHNALEDADVIGQTATLMFALSGSQHPDVLRGTTRLEPRNVMNFQYPSGGQANISI